MKIGSAAASLAGVELAHAGTGSRGVTVVVDAASFGGAAEPVEWAAGKLRAALAAKGVAVGTEGDRATLRVVAARVGGALAGEFAAGSAAIGGVTVPETVALIPRGAGSVLATGVDARGVVYGLLELAERVRFSEDAVGALRLAKASVETTPNKVRSCARAFCSEIEDKAWFYDRAFWTGYLDTLVTSRFNRFNFALGFGWDFPRGVTGDYLHFPYPYLVTVPGFEGVRVEPELEAGERERNLTMLKFVAAETARRGMDFQLGIWTHAYQWTDSPHSDHRIVGLTPETHAGYCRDALAEVLRECPQISGLTLRIHGESGIPEGSYPFWETLFEAVTGAGRRIEIDMHAKGLDATMIGIARKTGMPVKAGAKFWAEHQGLGYHQADIRAAEYPRAGVTGTFALSSGSRQFTRYGYGDFYQQGTGVELLYRVWPGTQRHLLWGDPALAAGYGRAAHFCGAAGMEICEPLTFKGREGSGKSGGRLAYKDHALASPTGELPDLDSGKFALTYLLWGRYLYNPETAGDVHERYMRHVYGAAGPALGEAIAAASRILPLVTTAWLPSASNHEFWPEMVTPPPIKPVEGKPLYGDSPAPHNVSAVSPLDPQLFASIEQHASNLVSGAVDPRYNTVEVSGWLTDLARTARESLERAGKLAGPRGKTPEFRRAELDVWILSSLGDFYANHFMAGLGYSLYTLTGHRNGLRVLMRGLYQSLHPWYSVAGWGGQAYSADVSYGATAFRRGSWADRTAALEAQFVAFRTLVNSGDENELRPGHENTPDVEGKWPLAEPRKRPVVACKHEPAEVFHPGDDLSLTLGTGSDVTGATLWYRHVNHAERWVSLRMKGDGGTYTAAIPAAYTESPFPLQYYFEVRADGGATFHPVLNRTLSNEPYFAVYRRV